MTRRALRRFRRQRRLERRYANHTPPARLAARVWNARDAMDAYRTGLPARLDAFFRRTYPADAVRRALGLSPA